MKSPTPLPMGVPGRLVLPCLCRHRPVRIVAVKRSHLPNRQPRFEWPQSVAAGSTACCCLTQVDEPRIVRWARALSRNRTQPIWLVLYPEGTRYTVRTLHLRSDMAARAPQPRTDYRCHPGHPPQLVQAKGKAGSLEASKKLGVEAPRCAAAGLGSQSAVPPTERNAPCESKDDLTTPPRLRTCRGELLLPRTKGFCLLMKILRSHFHSVIDMTIGAARLALLAHRRTHLSLFLFLGASAHTSCSAVGSAYVGPDNEPLAWDDLGTDALFELLGGVLPVERVHIHFECATPPYTHLRAELASSSCRSAPPTGPDTV